MYTWHNSGADGLGEDLAAYGLMRTIARKAAGSSQGSPNFFGLAQRNDGYELDFGTPEELACDPHKQLAIVVPDEENFDLLVTKDLQRAISMADPKTIREFVSRILDEV